MSDSDYYRVLGVSRNASADELRKAYKKLARENHPDRKPGDEQAAEKFKQVQEAYAILGDDEKRKKYDRFGSAAFQGGGRDPRDGAWAGGPAGGVDLGDLFGGLDLGDLFGGQFRGGAAPQPRAHRAPRTAKGQDAETQIQIPFHVAAEGGAHDLHMQVSGKSEQLSVKIPPGVRDGSTIRLSGQGHSGQHGGPAGDLLVKIKVAPHPFFRREGPNLILDLPVTPSEAALGSKIEVPTLSEGNVMLTVPPGTSSGAKLRLREKGVADPKGGTRGDQLVVIKIAMPKNLNDRAIELFENLADAAPQSPRDGLW
ncbi:MAG: molecular chaperone DnaJ [Planctomycetaceae bacterium]|nr:molecular chaperone DnaJ [Planctomycetaceae bacterium]